MPRKGKFVLAIRNHDINEVRRLLCTRQIPVNGGASHRDHFIIECFKVNQQDRMTCRKEEEPKILEMLKMLVQHGADVNVRGLRCSPRGMTAAMIAADQGLERCLRFLVESGADLILTADSGDNTLMMAARAGQADCVKYLTEHSESGSFLNKVNRKGDNALMMAARAGQVDCVKYLTEHSESGSLLNQVNEEGDNTLMMAARAGQVDCVKYLTEHSESGSFLNKVNRKGDNALMMAARAGQVDCVKYFTEHSVSESSLNQVNKAGYNALMVAAEAGQVDCVKYLTEHSELGSLLNRVNKEGHNALMMAAELGQVDCVKYLIERSVSESSLNQVNEEGQTALMVAASSSQDDHGLSVKLLVEARADVNMQDRYGRTALMLAVDRPPPYWTMGNNDTELDHTSKVQSLIKGEADLSLQDNSGRNALMIAIESNQSIAILKLLTENMSVSTLNQANKEGQTALMLAASNSDDDHAFFVKYLVEAGADLNMQDRGGSNALMMAASSSQKDHGLSVNFLVEAGADVNMQDRDGLTALMLAVDRPSYLKRRRNDTSRVQRLIKGGADLSLQDNKGRNALMTAIQSNQSIAILKLLTENMSVSILNQVNKEGQTALMMAASNHNQKNAICLLIAAGADLNVTDTKKGYTALMCAIDKRNNMAATLLLEKGALVNTVSRDLETPLSLILFFTRSDKGMVTELLSRGLDPALSCRDQGFLHTMVAENEGSVVRDLIMNGFPPVDIKCHLLTRRYSLYLPCLPQTTLMSPLALALTCIHHDIARYLIVNRFFSRYDFQYLCGNHELRQSLQRQIQWTGDTDITRAKKYLDILDFLSARPLSLRDLCLVTISSALSQYLVRDPQDIPPGDSRWMCQPTFKKRVQLLAVPPALKRELLHETSYSCIPCESWGDISLEEEM